MVVLDHQLSRTYISIVCPSLFVGIEPYYVVAPAVLSVLISASRVPYCNGNAQTYPTSTVVLCTTDLYAFSSVHLAQLGSLHTRDFMPRISCYNALTNALIITKRTWTYT